MDRMPDGNTAALRQHEAKQDRDSKLWDSDAERIAQYWTDNVMDGGYAYRKQWSLRDFRDDMSDDEFTLLMSVSRPETVVERHADMRLRLAKRIKEFFLQHCSDEIWEVINDRNGDE